MKLHTRILIGLIAGAAFGVAARQSDALARVLGWIEPAGTIFIRLITMVVVPLVIAGLFVGVASLGDIRRLGRIGGRTLAYFLGTTAIAAVIGVTVALIAGAGTGITPPPPVAGAAPIAPTTAAVPANAGAVPALWQTISGMVPANPIAAAAQGDLLAVIFTVVLFAAAATTLDNERRRPLVSFFGAANDVSLVVIQWLMTMAPPAVAILIAATVFRSGADLLRGLVSYVLIVLAALLIHAGLVLMPILRIGTGLGPGKFLGAVGDVLLLAFSTASSSVTSAGQRRRRANAARCFDRGVQLRLADRHDTQQERRRRLQSRHGSLPRSHVRSGPRPRHDRDDRADHDRCVLGGRGRARQFARHDNDRPQCDRARRQCGGGNRAGLRHRSAAGHVPHGGEHARQSRGDSGRRAGRGRTTARDMRDDDPMNGRTVSEKILSNRCGHPVRAGEIAVCTVDCVLGTDGSAPMAIDYFEQLAERVFDPARIFFSLDHYAPPNTPETHAFHSRIRRFADHQGVTVFEVGDGISHQLAVERGLVHPGDLIVGADSHTVTCGALNCFAIGVGSSDLAAAMFTGQVWLRVPQTIRVTLTGRLGRDVCR